jgi:Carboxypeptidase regulatory-like domain/TonB dependent receptor-like, beta-barrel
MKCNWDAFASNFSHWCGQAKRVVAGVLPALLLLTIFSVSNAFGQADSGSLAGTVKDASGAVVAGAKIEAKNLATSAMRTAESGGNGQFGIPGLAPGTYEVTVTSAGFAIYKAHVEITVGGALTLDAQLSLSGQATTVEVISGTGTEVNTQSQEISQIVTPEQISSMPSLTRNPYDFIALAGNVSGGDRTGNGNMQTSGAGQNNTDRGVGFSLNGQRSAGTEVLLDGAENTNVFDTTVALLIPQDAVQEFRVITNNFDAQYGRASGGVINLTTKTGTNALHGSTWEFNRLSAYTANTYDNDANGIPKGSYTRNQFGYTVGGPVKKDKLFFFQSTEWLRVRSSASVLAYVPTPQLLAATAGNTQAYFNAFGGGVPTSYISTITKSQANLAYKTTAECAALANPPANCGAFDAAVPDGTPVFGLVNYNAPVDAGGDVAQNTYTLVGRADYNLNDKTQMFFRFGRESLKELPGSVFSSPYSQYNVGETIFDNSYLLTVNHTFTPSVLSSTKLSFFRDTVAEQYNAALQNTPTLFLFNNATVNGTTVQFPGFFDFTTGTGGLPFGGPQNSIQWNEDLTWVKGKHTMRYGGQMNYIQVNRGFGAYAQAVEQVGKDQGTGLDNLTAGILTSFTAAADPGGAFPCAAGPYTGTSRGPSIATPQCTVTLPVSEPSFQRSDRYKDFAVYAQDGWRFSPRLTLNYGLRYEYYGVQHNANPKLDSNFYYGTGTNFFDQVRNGSIQIAPDSPIGELWKPSYGTLAPRVGFAYDVFGNGKTSVRGGYGISYERNFGNVTFNIIQNPPNNATLNVSNVPITVDNLGPLAGSSGTVLLPPVSPRNVAQNIQTAQTQFWGLAIDHQLGHRGIFAIEYNGAHGIHLYDIKNINELGGGQVYLGDPQSFFDASNNPLSCNPNCLTRPNQAFTSINNRGSGGFSHYNGLNIRYQTQDLWRTGLSIVSNYTYAHALDNISSTFSESSSSSNGVGNLGYLDPRDPGLDYGNADFDIRHRLVVSAIWNEPFLKGSTGWERQVAAGWTFVPIFTARTGVPFTIADSTNTLNGLTGPYGIVRYTPSTPITNFSTGAITGGTNNNFNILTLPAANSFTGLLGVSDFGPYPANMTARNAFRGPGAWNMDISLAKSFPITERIKLEFRAEGFNIFNHHDLFVNGFTADVALQGTPTGVVVQGKKGGLATLANNGNHDERRFGQFALRLSF